MVVPRSSPSTSGNARACHVDEAAQRRARPLRRGLWLPGAAALYLLASFWMTHDLWSAPAHSAVADNLSDAAQGDWYITWTPWAITHGRMPFHTDLLNSPSGVNLLWNTPVTLLGLLLAPATARFGGTSVVVLLTTLGPVLSAISAAVVLRRLGALRVSAVLAGLLYGFSPAMTAQSLGHVNLTMQPLLPVLVFLGLRIATQQNYRARNASCLGLAAIGQLLINQELLLLTGLALSLLLLVLLASRRPSVTSLYRPVMAYLLALCVFAVAAVPLIGFQLFGPGHGSGSPFNVGYFKVDLLSYVVPSRLQLLSTGDSQHQAQAFTGGLPEQTAYLGWPLLALALLALVMGWRNLHIRAALLPAFALSVCALGPVLAIGGKNTAVTLPWVWVTRTPLLTNALACRVPLLADLLLAAGLCFAYDELHRSERRWGRLVPALALLSLLPLVPAPLRAARIAPTPPYFTSAVGRAALDRAGSVLVLPFPNFNNTDAMRWQASSGMTFRMPGGYFIGPADDGRLYIGGQARPTQVMLMDIAETGFAPRVNAAVQSQVHDDLRYWQSAMVVIGPCKHQDVLKDFITASLGATPMMVEGVLVWRFDG